MYFIVKGVYKLFILLVSMVIKFKEVSSTY